MAGGDIRELYKHQKDALTATEGMQNCAFYHAMGSGKTYTGSERAMQFELPVLICCQKSKVEDWKQHFKENCPGWDTYDLTKQKEIAPYAESVKEGAKAAGVITYDTLWRRPQIMGLSGITLMCDESSLISNEKAKRTKALLKMNKSGQFRHVILLSGTPVDGKYERLLSQCWLLGWKVKKNAFWDRYVIYSELQPRGLPYAIKTVDGYKNESELKEKLKEHGAHFLTAEQCLSSLPDQVFTEIKTPAPASYKKMEKTGICVIDGEELVGDSLLARRILLRQLCSQYNTARLEAIKELLEVTEERVLIFYNYTAERNKIKEICEQLKKPFSEVSGQVKDLENYETKENSVTAIQYQAGAMGLNLQKARITVYASLPERSELYEQSKSRTWRTGQTKPCLYYICKSPGTIEDIISEALKHKKDLTDYLFEIEKEK